MNPLLKFPKIFFRNRFYKKSQFFTKNELELYQDHQLKKIVLYASKYVPYYRNLFAGTGFDANSFRGRDDLKKIPFLDKETLRRKKDEFISDLARKDLLEWSATSGSTGTPLKLVLDDSVVINKYSATFRAYRWAGYTTGSKIFRITDVSPDHETVWNYERLTRSLNFYSTQVSAPNSLVVNELLWKFRPRIFVGYGMSFLMMGRFIEQSGRKNWSPVAFVNYGESITGAVKTEIERLFGTKFYDYYSHKEAAVLINQCSEGGLHLAEDFSFHEVVDDNGNYLENGTGELVGTGFYNLTMPLIRYKTRDFVEIHPGTCRCGRNLRTVTSITGRKDDFIVTPEEKYLFLPEGAISYSKNVVLSQYIQERKDQLIVNLVVDEHFDRDEMEKIETGLKERFGHSMQFDFRIVDELEKTSAGKTKFIISRMGNLYE